MGPIRHTVAEQVGNDQDNLGISVLRTLTMLYLELHQTATHSSGLRVRELVATLPCRLVEHFPVNVLATRVRATKSYGGLDRHILLPDGYTASSISNHAGHGDN